MPAASIWCAGSLFFLLSFLCECIVCIVLVYMHNECQAFLCFVDILLGRCETFASLVDGGDAVRSHSQLTAAVAAAGFCAKAYSAERKTVFMDMDAARASLCGRAMLLL